MPSQLPRYTLRIEKEILEKLNVIAKNNERSTNQEIVYLIKKHVEKYENQNGNIIIQNNSHFGDININK